MSDIGFGPVGDPPIIYDTERKDGYGRVTRLVDRRLLEQAEVRIAEVGVFARSLLGDQVDGDTPGLDSESEGIVVAHSHLIGRRIQDIIDGKHSPIVVPESRNACSIVDDILERQDGEGSHNAARRVVAERDHWRAEAEKARTPDAGNPKDVRFAAEVARQLCDSRRGGGWYATSCRFTAEADRLESEATADDVEYPETLAVAKMIYENLPSEDPGGGVEPWDELTDEQRAPFLMNARNLGHVFPEEYPKLAAELARYRATATADDVGERFVATLGDCGVVAHTSSGLDNLRQAAERLISAGLLRGDR